MRTVNLWCYLNGTLVILVSRYRYAICVMRYLNCMELIKIKRRNVEWQVTSRYESQSVLLGQMHDFFQISLHRNSVPSWAVLSPLFFIHFYSVTLRTYMQVTGCGFHSSHREILYIFHQPSTMRYSCNFKVVCQLLELIWAWLAATILSCQE
jgi:hypothetical protein